MSGTVVHVVDSAPPCTNEPCTFSHAQPAFAVIELGAGESGTSRIPAGPVIIWMRSGTEDPRETRHRFSDCQLLLIGMISFCLPQDSHTPDPSPEIPFLPNSPLQLALTIPNRFDQALAGDPVQARKILANYQARWAGSRLGFLGRSKMPGSPGDGEPGPGGRRPGGESRIDLGHPSGCCGFRGSVAGSPNASSLGSGR